MAVANDPNLEKFTVEVVKESLVNIDFAPTDVNEIRAMLIQSLSGARMRWKQLDLERISREMTLKQAADGKLRATKYRDNAQTELKAQVDSRLAQLHADQQQLENEIRVYSNELKSLPKDE